MSKSLTLKIFIITFISFMLIITSIILFNSIYFNKAYESKKINDIVNKLNQFSAEYSEKKWNEFDLYRKIDSFNINNNVQLSLVKSSEKSLAFPYYSLQDIENGYYGETIVDDQTYKNMVYIITITDNKDYYDLVIKGEDYHLAFSKDIYKGQSLDLEGVLKENNIIIPLTIDEAVLVKDIESNISGYFKIVDIKYIEDKGDVNNIFGELDTAIATPYNNMAIDEDKIKHQIIKNGDVEYLIDNTPYTDMKQVTFYKTTKNNKGKEIGLLVYASLQPINEAVKVINSYAVYFYIIAAVLSVLIAYLYSHYVTNPIKKLSYTAKEISEMNFAVRTDINRNDELGVLSNSINKMSANLKNTLHDLKEANEKLKEDYNHKVKMEQVRREFVANVSHELKTPLGVIKSFSEAIKDGIKKDKESYYLNVILDESDKMEYLIKEMLELSKIESGAIKVNNTEFNIEEIIKEAVKLHEIMIIEKKVRVSILGNYKQVISDRKKIQQVINNLVSNAIKYCEENSVVEIIGIVEKGHNCITIRNTCKNLQHSDIEDLWNRFYKVDKSHNRSLGGTGLGLAIVKAIFENLNIEYHADYKNDIISFSFKLNLAFN